MRGTSRVVALIVAAGQGARVGGGVPKQYRLIAGKPVLVHAVDALLRHPAVDTVQVVIGGGHEDLYHHALGGHGLPPPIIGGEARRDSVIAGLEAIDTDIVMIHDAARPFLPPQVIDRLLDALDAAQGATPALAVADTLARGDALLGDTVSRTGLYRIQTPQTFHRSDILAAHKAWSGGDATDDAQVARAFGLDVAIVKGDRRLEKLTFEGDFDAAIGNMQMISRTAMGFDVHAFEDGDAVWLGGVAIPHSKKLAGHSDADVALHAIVDALLGTICAGDIGSHFPPSDPQWKGAASHLFLTHARDLVAEAGGIIDHVDLTIICEAPKVGVHRGQIRAQIAQLLHLSVDRISVKATTTEKLGFTGRGEGIAAQAVATVRLPQS